MADQPLAVALDPPERFDWTWVYRDSESDESVGFVECQLERLDLIGGLPVSTEPIRTDGSGFVRIEDAVAGSYRLVSRVEGYDESVLDLDVPGVYRPWLVNGTLDVRSVYLEPFHLHRFQLIGADDWGGGEGFTLAVQDTTRRGQIPFDRSGLAEAPIAGDWTTLELAIDYPDGQRKLLYLAPGYHRDGTPNEIDVRIEQSVEVDLRVEDALEETLFSGDVALVLSYRSEHGDTVEFAKMIESDGVFRFEGRFPDHVCVHVLASFDRRAEVWALHEFEVARGAELTHVTLNAAAPPLDLCVRDGGEPLGDANVLLRLVPNRTDWVGGGDILDGECLPVPRIGGDRVVLECFVGDELRALDVPVLLGTSESSMSLDLRPFITSDFEVTLDGEPMPSAVVLVQGQVTGGLDGATLRANTAGVTPGLRLMVGSRAVASPLPASTEWVIDERVPVVGGRNTLRMASTGELAAGLRDALLSATTSRGVSVASWCSEGRTGIEAAEGGGFSVRVPVGTYSHVTADGTEQAIVVRSGESTWLP